MRRPRLTTVFTLVLLSFATAIPPASAQGTIEFCRAERDGTFSLQLLGTRAAERVAEHVGGGAVGGPVPDTPGYVFGDDCVPRLAVIAEAWSVAEDGSSVAMARLEDIDGDGLPSGGDIVRTARYPLGLAVTGFGDFTTTVFTVADGSLTTAADGAIEVRARSGCGTMDCWFFWAVLDEGTRGYERYAEYRSVDGGIPTDNTGFFDGRDDECTSESCSGAFVFDVMFVRPSSPSGPGHLVFDAAVSPADDDFLEVRIGD